MTGSIASAQVDVVLWGANPGEGDFDGGLNGWTSVVSTLSTNPTDDWVVTTADPFIGAQIISPTAANGVAMFDAAEMTLSVNPNPGAPPYPFHIADLLSPIIDCSAMPEVSVKFYQYNEPLNGDCFFSYSVDGGATFSTPINVNPDVAANGESDNPSIKYYDLPGASGSSQVQLKFTADMDFYTWIIDDVQIIEKPGNDLTLANDFIAIAPTFAMPKSSVDTVRFLADITNNGANDATNVVLSVDVTRDSDGASVFTATNPYGTLLAGDTVENQIFTDVFVPDTIVDSYTVTYTLSSDSTDAIPGDNTFSYQFEVTADYFDKIPTFTRNLSPSADNSYTYGTTYQVFNGTTIGGDNNLDTLYRYVSTVNVGVANPDELAGQSVTVFIEKPISGTEFNVNPTTGAIAQGDRSIVGFGTYTFMGNEPDDVVLDIAIEDFNVGGALLELESGVNYIVVMQYTAPDPNTDLFMLASQSQLTNYGAANFAADAAGVQRFSQILDVGNSGDYGTVGFVAGITPFIRLNFVEDFKTSTKTPALAQNALTVFPNPAAEFVTATLDLEEVAKDVTLTIFNASGQVMETRNLGNVINEQVSFDLSNYTSGMYYMSIQTEKGHSIKRFIVAE